METPIEECKACLSPLFEYEENKYGCDECKKTWTRENDGKIYCDTMYFAPIVLKRY